MKTQSRPFAVTRPSCFRFCGGVFFALVLVVFSAAPAPSATFALGATALLEGPTAGSGSVVLAATPPTATWTATPNATWLHLSAANQSGTGSTNVVFTYDTNPGATRTGTLTIASLTLTLTQAGSTYCPTSVLVKIPDTVGLMFTVPGGVAVDGAGNVYIADTANTIKKWTATNNTVTTLVSSGLNTPFDVAVDGANNVYIADYGSNAILKLPAGGNTLKTLVSSGLNQPTGVALDGAANVYIADSSNNAVKVWIAASNTVKTLVSSGLSYPTGVAVDAAGNVYIADANMIYKWTAANSNVTTLVSSGVNTFFSVAVDGSGNVYITDYTNNAIKEWVAASNTVTPLVSSGLDEPWGVAVDGAGNVYIVNHGYNTICELPYALVDTTAKSENAAAGSDVLPVVLPSTENLCAPFAPTSSQPWLTISGITNGVVTFAFSANAAASNRIANITLLGQTISVTQAPPPTLVDAATLGSGVFQFAFSNINPSASFTVLSAANLWLPLTNWTVIGTASNIAPGLFQFTDTTATNSQRYYTVRSP